MVNALLGTNQGVFRLDNHGLTSLGLRDQPISAIHAGNQVDGATTLLAGSYGNGLFRSVDDGRHWTAVENGPTAPAFQTFSPDPFHAGAILCGTEPARIFRTVDEGVSWQELSGIGALDSVDEWFLPYSPRAGAVRNLYSPPGTNRLLASVEVGGLLVSHDQGETWAIGPVLGDTDIHHITGHPGDPDLLFASLGTASLKRMQRSPDAPPLGGVARSQDGGRSWTKFHTDYTRATIIPPTRPDLILAGPAKRVGGLGRIDVSGDGGETWQPAGDGIESPITDMVERFLAAPDDSIWAICSGGRLFRAEPGEWRWRSLLPDDAKVTVESVAFLPAS